MRTRLVSASAGALLVLAICASCGGGGGSGGSAGDGGAAPADTGPANVSLTWRGSEDIAGYVVHWGTVSRAYSHDVDVLKPPMDADGNVAVVIALDGGAAAAVYYFAITSYDAAGNSSDYSNELATAVASTP
jgi:hypothetical protein